MTPPHALSIGQVAFPIDGPFDLVDAAPPPAADPYASFHKPAVPELDLLDVPIRIALHDQDDLPDRGGAPVIWNQGGWGLARVADGYRLWGPAGPAHVPPLWTAWFSPSFDRVELSLSEDYRRGRDDRPAVANPLRYPLDQVLLLYALARREGCIVHAAAVVLEGRAFVFPGRSGAGKSTLTRQFQARGWPDLLSDDRVVIRRIGGRLWAFGTPWPGDAGVARNAGAPLGGIVFLRHATEHQLTVLSPAEGLARLLPAASIPWYHAEVLPGLLDFAGSVLRAVPVWELSFRPEPAVVAFLGSRLASP